MPWRIHLDVAEFGEILKTQGLSMNSNLENGVMRSRHGKTMSRQVRSLEEREAYRRGC